MATVTKITAQRGTGGPFETAWRRHITHGEDPTDVVTYEDAIRSDDALLRLRGHTLDAVAAVVPAAVAGLIALSRRRTVEYAIGLETPAGAGAWERLLGDRGVADPFDPRHMADIGAPVVGIDGLGEGADAYRRHLRTLGLADRVVVYLRSTGTVVAVASLARSLEQQAFTSVDELRLRRIQPLVEAAYVCGLEPRSDPARAVVQAAGLSDREADVAELVGRGATNAEIARSLHVSETTVKAHLRRIYARTGVHTRTQLALLVGRH